MNNYLRHTCSTFWIILYLISQIHTQNQQKMIADIAGNPQNKPGVVLFSTWLQMPFSPSWGFWRIFFIYLDIPLNIRDILSWKADILPI